jgi:hypothetical protein
MKKLPYYLPLFLIILYSCKKSNPGGSTPPSPYYLSSAVASTTQRRIVDSFYYDTLHRVDTFTQTIYDTTSGTPVFNTWTIQFLYQDNNTQPSWYNYYDLPLGGFGDYHLLSYDANNRIAKDTSLSGSGEVTYYSYPNGNIATTILPEGTPENNFMDTMYISSGNISKEVLWISEIPGQPDAFAGDADFTYASYANPGYHAAFSNTIGPLLSGYTLSNDASIVDFTSKNAMQTENGTETFAPLNIPILNYTLTPDNKGRVAEMTSGTGASGATIAFSYY